MSYCPAHGFFIGTSCTLCWINGPLRICPKHDWNMGTYCAACRDEALEAYRKVCIGGYKICNKHGPYSEPSCQKCQSELNENMSRIAESIAQREDTMKAPTEEQLRDPAWWDENVPSGCEKVGVAYIDGKVWSHEFMMPGVTAMTSPCNADVRFFSRPFRPEPTKEERLAQHIAERDAFLAEDEAQPQAWDGEGLPPVDEWVEHCKHGGWATTKVVGFDGSMPVCSHGEGKYYGVPVSKMRPLRAKDLRDRERHDLTKIIKEAIRLGLNEQGISNMVWSAGWRKGVE